MMTCDVVDNAQMIVIGGTYSNDTTYMCDADIVWGTHNMNLGEENPDKAMWAAYTPTLTTYTVPDDILTAVGGQGTGGATVTAPTTGFDSPHVSLQMSRNPTIAVRTPTRHIPPATDSPSSPLSTGAIAGIAVGSGVAGIALAALFFFLIYRWRQRRKRMQDGASTVISWDMNPAAPGMMPSPLFQQQAHPSELPDDRDYHAGWRPQMSAVSIGGKSSNTPPTRRAYSIATPPVELSSPGVSGDWHTYDGGQGRTV
jgi:hypothetical protein